MEKKRQVERTGLRFTIEVHFAAADRLWRKEKQGEAKIYPDVQMLSHRAYNFEMSSRCSRFVVQRRS